MLGGFDTFLLWTNLGISLLVLVAASYFALSLKQALLATIVGGLIGNAMLARRGDDRRRRARALDGAPARAARPARLLPRDRAERAPVPRLGDLRADRDRDRRGRALGSRVRLPRHLALEARLRRARDGARAARPGRVRAPVRPQARDLGRARVGALPRLVDPRPRRRLDASGASRARAARSGSRSTS